MRFKNKVVLITGSSRGIGRATAIAFAKEGAKVIINYVKNKEAGEKTVGEIKNLGTEAIAIQADIASESDVKRMVEEAVQKFGAIDILINNAGIVWDIPIFTKTVEQWERTLRVNLIGAFLCAKYVVPHMKDRVGASILNISSTNGIDSGGPESID